MNNEGQLLPCDLWAKQRATDLTVFVQDMHHQRRVRGETRVAHYPVEDWDDLFAIWLTETGRVPEWYLSIARKDCAAGADSFPSDDEHVTLNELGIEA